MIQQKFSKKSLFLEMKSKKSVHLILNEVGSGRLYISHSLKTKIGMLERFTY